MDKKLDGKAECKECGAKQAQIDRLMLEYCPDEMTPEQMQEWGNNQRPVEQAEQEPVLYPVRRGSRITCIESGEKCVVWATSHTDCWVQFPDGHAGQYTYEQIGKYFSIDENQAADEAYERGLKEGIEAGKKIAKQVKQNPIGWTVASNLVDDGYGHSFTVVSSEPANTTSEPYIPLYAAPVHTKDLTDDEIYKLADDVDWAAGAYLGFARAVIQEFRRKNGIV